MGRNDIVQIAAWAETRRDLRIALLAICMVGILAVGAVFQIFAISKASFEYGREVEISFERQDAVRGILRGLERSGALRSGDVQEGYPSGRSASERWRAAVTAQTNALLLTSRQSGPESVRIREFAETVADYLRTGQGAERLPADPDAARVRDLPGADQIRTIQAAGADLISLENARMHAASEFMKTRVVGSRLILLVFLCSIVVLMAGAALTVIAYLVNRKRVEQQLVEARKMAEAANRAKSEFLASMSHEIRTPLASIVGFTELLLDGPLNKRQRQFIERLQTSGAGLLALVNDILDFSKIEASEIDIEQEPFSIGALLADVLSIVSVDLGCKDIELIDEIDPDLPERVIGDGMRLRQVLLNLLNNAVKFTERGSVVLRVGQDGDRIRFEVHDTGIGIPRHKHGDLFQHFSQVDSSIQRQYGGTGLGLAISRRLVLLMGGDIGFESEPGTGSRFWFALPLPRTEQLQATSEAEAATVRVPGGRILLVEDSRQNQELIRTILTSAGCAVDVACDGEEALRAVQSVQFDLILMDMQMPRVDGLEATRRIRQMGGPMRDVPIIAITANVLAEHLVRFKEAGTNDCIAKPFRKAHLIAAVNRWLPQRSVDGAAERTGPAEEVLHDPRILRELTALMGESWVHEALNRLRTKVAQLSGYPACTEHASRELKRHAHQIVAEAGQLGFPELSRRCGDLEHACRSGYGLEAALGAALVAGRRAEAWIDARLAEPNRARRETGAGSAEAALLAS